jgi:hypothetical protein
VCATWNYQVPFSRVPDEFRLKVLELVIGEIVRDQIGEARELLKFHETAILIFSIVGKQKGSLGLRVGITWDVRKLPGGHQRCEPLGRMTKPAWAWVLLARLALAASRGLAGPKRPGRLPRQVD